jgi:hypothetical protein
MGHKRKLDYSTTSSANASGAGRNWPTGLVMHLTYSPLAFRQPANTMLAIDLGL